jgi:hypothetical protein
MANTAASASIANPIAIISTAPVSIERAVYPSASSQIGSHRHSASAHRYLRMKAGPVLSWGGEGGQRPSVGYSI